ncbi:MAG: GGDEF domain-containing protein [Candidatus Gastranaerophilaceae bacterium]|jgi:diguanylate cyclase (GGDEF)-like protein
MNNIIIYAENKTSEIESILKKNDNYSVRIKSIEEIKEAAQLNPHLIVLECSNDVVKDIVIRNKFTSPLLIIADNILDLSTVRADSYDYILKPVNEKELQIRIENLLKIKELKEQIEIVSTTDELTGLYNRKYLHERLDVELSRAKRYKLSLSCLLIDIDFFKVVNDMYGYDWGDILLKHISEIMKNYARKEDVLTRYGDEEFLILLPNTDEEHAFLFAERLRRDIEKFRFFPENEEEPHPITVSGGVASYPFLENVDENANTLIRYSEHALYNAKKRGKNKIIQFSQINLEF